MLVIILSNLMSASGELNSESKGRADLALRWEARIKSEKIITTGWDYRSDSSLTISEAFGRYLVFKKPELSSKILFQSYSRDTVGDAFFTRLLVEKKKIPCDQGIHIITSDYHCRRAKEIFEFVFPSAYAVNASGSPTKNMNPSLQKKESESLLAFRRSFLGIRDSDIQDIYKVLRNSHPYYNGDVFAKIDSLEKIISEI